MKYLVNRETKEHIRYNDDKMPPVGIWKIVEADADGWIPFDGRERPLPEHVLCEIVTDNDSARAVKEALRADRWAWNLTSGDPARIIAYRPVLAEKEEAQPKSMLGPDFDFTSTGKMPYSAHSPSVFDRLKSAIAASESIPAIIAEIDALLPAGYCVTKREAEQPPEGMTDWRNWREGDLVEAIETYKDYYIQGDTYKIRRIFGGTIYTEFDAKGSPHNGWAPRFFRFHSRPEKVTE